MGLIESIMINNTIKLPQIFWSTLDKLGLSPVLIIKQAKLPLAVMHSDTRLTTKDFFQLCHALEQVGGVDIGFKVVSAIENGQLPPAYLVAYHAKDLKDAIYRVARYKHLCTPETLMLTELDNGLKITIDWALSGVATPNILIDATMYSLVRLAQQGTGKNITPLEISLTRPILQAHTLFESCPVQYNSSQNSTTFSKQDLAMPFIQYNQELLAILDNALQKQSQDIHNQASYSLQVKYVLRQSLTAGRPELRFVAKELAISERSLQRHLKNEGESFQSLLSQTRHELACEYLKDARLDLAEITYLLGYEEQASFFRIFQEWENTTPAKWRQRYFNTHD